MKKLKNLFVALLAAALLLSLAVPALASVVPLVDPNLCPYCGIGPYSEKIQDVIYDNIDQRVCIDYGAPYIDELQQKNDTL